jgi:hypothetical protein
MGREGRSERSAAALKRAQAASQEAAERRLSECGAMIVVLAAGRGWRIAQKLGLHYSTVRRDMERLGVKKA